MQIHADIHWAAFMAEIYTLCSNRAVIRFHVDIQHSSYTIAWRLNYDFESCAGLIQCRHN